ncbi:hypothetical protein JKP88DRAFT_278848 [Tribonema minus]|uniref:Uncharacterized protein n=1 Tax=Tribonema minus TaxID=303371 RepID=A0A835YTU7_9STRA|nr:hypothetical protein JKP88DRAFT_278848 [Tribonema minus]
MAAQPGQPSQAYGQAEQGPSTMAAASSHSPLVDADSAGSDSKDLAARLTALEQGQQAFQQQMQHDSQQLQQAIAALTAQIQSVQQIQQMLRQTQQQMLEDLSDVQLEAKRNHARVPNARASLTDYEPLRALPVKPSAHVPPCFPQNMKALRGLSVEHADTLLEAYELTAPAEATLLSKIAILAIFLGVAS